MALVEDGLGLEGYLTLLCWMEESWVDWEMVGENMMRRDVQEVSGWSCSTYAFLL